MVTAPDPARERLPHGRSVPLAASTADVGPHPSRADPTEPSPRPLPLKAPPRAASGLAALGRLLSLGEVAEALGVGKRSVQVWVATGRLPVIRVTPRVVRVAEADLVAMLAAGRHVGGGG